jgi:hypothetical protein
MIASSRPLLAALSIGTLLYAACNAPNPVDMPSAEIAFVADTTPAAYFAPGVLDSFELAWLGGTLRSMGEPPLDRATMPAGTTVFRLLWLRSFDPDVAIRVSESATRCTVTTTIIGRREDTYSAPDSQGIETWVSSRPGPILRHDSISMPLQNCADLRARVSAARLWSGPAFDGVMGLDGDVVAFEMADAHGHRFAQRWSPWERHAPEFHTLSYAFTTRARVDPASNVGR